MTHYPKRRDARFPLAESHGEAPFRSENTPSDRKDNGVPMSAYGYERK